MKLLLDTCCLLWALQDVQRLSPTALRALKDPDNTLSVSVLSFWEISIKASLGKLGLQGCSPEDFPKIVEDSGWNILPLDPVVVASSGRLPHLANHRDPFDRLLVWQATCGDFALVSRDNAMNIYSPHGLKVCW